MHFVALGIATVGITFPITAEDQFAPIVRDAGFELVQQHRLLGPPCTRRNSDTASFTGRPSLALVGALAWRAEPALEHPVGALLCGEIAQGLIVIWLRAQFVGQR
jgi:hypothetical protein